MSQQTLYEEIINEIGTQAFARLGLSIFNLNSYGAYSESVKATNNIYKSQERHAKNPNGFGFYFEDLGVGQNNITATFNKSGQRTYTTDQLAAIKKVLDINKSGKNIQNLNPKDKANYLFITENYHEEINNWNPNFEKFAVKNHTSTDVVTFDKDNNVIKTSQYKVIKDTNGLLEERYLENNDVFTVPFDDYKKHKNNLETMIDNPKLSPEKKIKAAKALKMLEENNVTNRLMAENPKTTAILTQTASGTIHIMQTGVSDAIVQSLSVLVNGIVFEIKDVCTSDSKTSVTERVKRLLTAVLNEFSKTFKRGASFSLLDIVIDTLSQIFKTIFSQLKLLWRSLRNATKSIYNAVYSFIKGEIETKDQLIRTIIKALVGATMVINTITLENTLHVYLSGLVTPVVSAFLSPVLAIFIGAVATVIMTKQIDNALNVFFTAFAERDLSRERRDKIMEICDEYIPKLVEQSEELKDLIHQTYQERNKTMNESFATFTQGVNQQDSEKIAEGLIKINALFGKELRFKNRKEFDNFMASDEEFVL